jgi:hypothetical protein
MTQFGAPEETPAIVPVEQIDRDAALAAGRTWAQWQPQQIRIVEEGRGDDCRLVQLLARHRLAVLAQAIEAREGQDSEAGLIAEGAESAVGEADAPNLNVPTPIDPE